MPEADTGLVRHGSHPARFEQLDDLRIITIICAFVPPRFPQVSTENPTGAALNPDLI
jgi:hypothetical protein